MKDEPYLLRLCVNAFLTDPGEWTRNIQHISKSSRQLSLPQPFVGMWHDIFTVCLDKNKPHPEIPTVILASNLLRKINNSVSYKILDSEKQLQEFVLKTTCVLLRMGFLNNDPKLSRLGFLSGCIRSDYFQSPLFGEADVKELIVRIKDGLAPDGTFTNKNLLRQVLAITTATPIANLEAIAPIIAAILDSVMNIYDQVYYDFASDKSGKLPMEFLLLFSNVAKFENSVFIAQTKQLFSQKKISVSKLQNIVMKKKTTPTTPATNQAPKASPKGAEGDSSLARGYLRFIHHAQTLLYFYQLQQSDANKTSTLKELTNIISVFEKRAPKKLNLLSGISIDIGESISKESNKASRSRYSSDNTNLKVLSKLLGRKV